MFAIGHSHEGKKWKLGYQFSCIWADVSLTFSTCTNFCSCWADEWPQFGFWLLTLNSARFDFSICLSVTKDKRISISFFSIYCRAMVSEFLRTRIKANPSFWKHATETWSYHVMMHVNILPWRLSLDWDQWLCKTSSKLHLKCLGRQECIVLNNVRYAGSNPEQEPFHLTATSL